MACNTKHGPATAIKFYEKATGVKLTQQDWHLIREAAEADAGGKLSRARVPEHVAANAFMELADIANRDEHVPTHEVEDTCAEFVKAGNTTGTIEMLRHLSRKGLPESVTSRTRRSGKSKLPASGDEGIVAGMTNQCPACHQFSGEGHVCPPEALRGYAVAEDTQSADWYEQRFVADQKRLAYAETLHHMNGEKRGYGRNGRGEYANDINTTIAELQQRVREAEDAGEMHLQGVKNWTAVRDAKSYLAKYDEQALEVARLNGLLAEANERYEQFRWNRAFLVLTNGQGHVHKSMNCSTCYPTTRFNWVTDYSGSSEEQIVSDAGERACTVCYPSAPVDVLSRPSKIFSDDEKRKVEEREQRKVEKEAKAKEKAAKAATKDGSELVVVTERGITPSHMRNAGQPYTRTESFKTERAASMWAVDKMVWGEWRASNRSDDAGSAPDGLSDAERDAITAIAESLADKRGVSVDDIRAEFAKKAGAKKKRDR